MHTAFFSGERMHFSLHDSFKVLFIFWICAVFELSNLIGCTHEQKHPIVIINKPVVDFFIKIPKNSKEVGASPELQSCHRAHQGIFNEPFCVISERKNSFIITSPTIKNKNNEETPFEIESQYATVIEPQSKLVKAIPIFNPDKKIITLLCPWNIYSIGTQFVAKKIDPTNNHYSVLIPDFEKTIIIEGQIPYTMTIECLPSTDPKARFLACVKKIYKMTQFANHRIPYVWGGTSFIKNDNNHPFYLNDGNWHLDRADNSMPYTGFDCSGLIWRVLKMTGYSQPWRNSLDMAQQYKKVTSYKELQKGDLLWFPGHIVIIANKQKGTIIEARGYSSGHGKVHKIKVDQLLQGITCFQEIFNHLDTNKALYTVGSEKQITDCAFLSITQ
jgi:hypothetical protein